MALMRSRSTRCAVESSRKSGGDDKIAKKWILEGIQESSKRTTADEIKEDAENETSQVEEKNDADAVNHAPVEMGNAGAKNDEAVQVEDVREEEWEEVASKASNANTNSSASSTSNKKTSKGDSWMEPVDGDTVEKSSSSLISAL
jgi:hypothetical protein